MSFEIDVLENIAIFSGKHLCWSLFFSYQKGTPTKVLTWEYCKIVGNSLFYRIPSERFHYEYFSVKFPNSGKLYQQLELEYLNQRRWWDVYICFMILLNFQYIMLFKFNKNYFRQPDLAYFLPEKKNLKNATFPCVVNRCRKPDPDIWAYRKIGTQDYKLGPGTQDYGKGPQDRTLGWDTKVGLYGGTLSRDSRMEP